MLNQVIWNKLQFGRNEKVFFGNERLIVKENGRIRYALEELRNE